MNSSYSSTTRYWDGAVVYVTQLFQAMLTSKKERENHTRHKQNLVADGLGINRLFM